MRKRKKRHQPIKRANLYFGRGEISGFTAAGITGFSDLNPTAIVREIMQNSLDAAREARRDVARIRFEMERQNLTDVPGIQQYRNVFDQRKARSKRFACRP